MDGSALPLESALWPSPNNPWKSASSVLTGSALSTELGVLCGIVPSEQSGVNYQNTNVDYVFAKTNTPYRFPTSQQLPLGTRQAPQKSLMPIEGGKKKKKQLPPLVEGPPPRGPAPTPSGGNTPRGPPPVVSSLVRRALASVMEPTGGRQGGGGESRAPVGPWAPGFSEVKLNVSKWYWDGIPTVGR